MKRVIGILASTLVWLAPAAARAEEPPDLQFVHALRAKGYADLALEYLQKLKANPPAGVTPADLTLESAMAGIDAAQAETDNAKRQNRYEQARTDLETFLKANPTSPRASEATLSLARIVALQGKSLLTNAKRQDNPLAQDAEKAKARTVLLDAEQRLTQAAAQITDDQLKLQAQYELGVSLMDQAQTYNEKNGDELLKRSEIIKRAKEQVFEKLASGDEKNPLTWEAKAWVGRCWEEIDEPGKALDIFKKINAETGTAVETGKALAAFFYLLVLDRRPDVYKGKGDVLTEIIHQGDAWLQTYPALASSPIAAAIQYLVADAYLRMVAKMPATMQSSAAAHDDYAKAQKLYEAVEKTDNEYSARATQSKLYIILQLSGQRSHGDVSKLMTFQECYVQAQVAVGEMNAENKKFAALASPSDKEKEQHEQKVKQQLQYVVSALSRALDLANDQTPANDRGEVAYMLTYSYFMLGDPDRAAVVAEELARTFPTAKRAADAAAYALQAYSQVQAREDGGEKRPEVINADIARISRLAHYMAQTWPDDPATDAAHHQLGIIAMRDKNFTEAVAQLSQIKPAYSAFVFSQFDLANAAINAADNDLKPPKGGSYKDIAIDALKKIPEVPDSADASTAQIYMYAELKLVRILFAAKQFKDVEDLTDKLNKKFQAIKMKLDDKIQDELQSTLDTLPLYIASGRADMAFKAGDYAGVRTALDPIVNDVRDGKREVKDTQLLRGILGLCLRANVQLGDMTRAKEILAELEKTVGELDKGGVTSILVALVQQLKDQVKELQAQGPSKQKELDDTVAKFSAFLDELAKQPSLTPDIIRFLAFSYGGIDQHEKAAAEYASLPKADDEAANYNTQMLYARELRLAKKFDDAKKVIDEVTKTPLGQRSLEVKKEQIYLKEDQDTPGGYVAAAKDWQAMMKSLQPLISPSPTLIKTDAELRRLNDKAEQGLPLTQEETDSKPKLEEIKTQEVKKQDMLRNEYYDCYYHLSLDIYHNALKMKDDAKKTDNIKQAASFILRLESSQNDVITRSDTEIKALDDKVAQGGQLTKEEQDRKKDLEEAKGRATAVKDSMKKRYDDLFLKEPPLKEQYDELKKAA